MSAPISGLVDIRSRLFTNPNGGPRATHPLRYKHGLVVHYGGPPVDLNKSDLQIIRGYAHYHITKDWDENPHNGATTQGDGLMYHICIGRDGTKYQTRDLEDVLWHCGAWPQNRTALSVHVLIGGNQHPSEAALRSLTEVANDWFASGHGDPRTQTWGHKELGQTNCPGDSLMVKFVYPFRAGKEVIRMDPDGMWFPETSHYIGGGFWTFWNRNGGLQVFGYPLTDEIQEVDRDGKKRTTQYFERAIFRYFPEHRGTIYEVQLDRLGAEALARKG